MNARALVAATTTVAAVAGIVIVTGLVAGPQGSSQGSSQRSAPSPVRHLRSVRPAPPPETVVRPNVLMVMTDDMRADDVRFMPNVRHWIADRGVTWRNAFAPTPLCCPSRASFLTGKYTHNHGVMSHQDPWGYQSFDDSRTLATALTETGYRTGYVGKYLNGFGADVPRAAPERSDSFTYVPNGWTDWRAAVDEAPYPETDPRHGSTYDYFHLTLDVNGELVGHPGRYSSDVLADNAVDMLDGFTQALDPWFLMVNSTAPHHGAPREPDDPAPVYDASGQLQPMVTPARPEWVKGKFDDVILRGPGVRPDGTTEADVSDKMHQTSVRTELDDSERASLLEAARQRAEALFALDRALGRVFDRLRDSGELDRTTLVFTTDNGYMLGEHRWREGKVVGYEPSYRIPMLMAGPGVPAGENRYSPISMIDLTSTILDWADAGLAGTDGRSVAADLESDRGWTTPIGYEALLVGVHRSAGVRGFPDARTSIGIRTARYAYLRYVNGQVELFDLARDPLELQSVAGKPAYRSVQRELARVWVGFKSCRGDDCRRPLPPDLRTSTVRTIELRVLMAKAERAYYGRPPG